MQHGRVKGTIMEDTIESSCSRECQYMFHECEADGTPGGECRVYYNDCVEECTETLPGEASAVPV
jgi:hypothetical protein